ncbi:hypothetical protein EDC01DRAFT_613135 [Geopyxis carbonaria]|nr:hypothetical protein EDC01DRAFT_613135 [Geopyxis carbonaria]
MSANQSSPDSLESLLREISLADDEVDHEKVLKQANQSLKASKGDITALQTKIVALLHLDRHEDALRVFKSNAGKPLEETAQLELAYCVYKTGDLKRAIELAEKALPGKSSRAFKHIAAQAYYRLENFEETAKLCTSLANGNYEAPNEEGDLRVNSQATDAQLAWSGKCALVGDKKTTREDLDVFEATFNAACLSIAKGEYNQALILLKRAKQLCNSLEDLNDEEKLAELEPVTAQEIYVLSRTGKLEEALRLVEEFDSENVSDDALKVISAINKISIMCQLKDFNPYLAWQQYNQATKQATSLASRPFDFQSHLLLLNEPIIDLGIGKTCAAEKKATAYHNSYATDNNINVVNAAAKTANMSGKDVTKKIEQMFLSNQKDIGLALTSIQLRMGAGNITGSIEILEKLFENLEPQMRYQPGLVGLMVALLDHQGRKKYMREILYKASEWWKNLSSPNPYILRAAGKSMLESDSLSDLASAGELFSSLLHLNPSDQVSAAGLVASFATSDPSAISNHVENLTPVTTLISGIDVAALEAAGVAQPSKKRGADIPIISARPKKVRRKPKLPKNFDPLKKVDPERWLPMRDRSYYKPKGRKDKKKAAAITQGGPVEESMELAGGGRVDVVKVEQGKKTGGGGGGANKKKKKKGGKW